MANEEKITCIGCPLGCSITIAIDDKGEVTSIDGYKCKAGKKYALEEYHNPVRVLTATVLTQDGSQPLLPVRTAAPIIKTKLPEVMRVLAKVRARPPIRIGDAIISNVLNTGVNVVATADLSLVRTETAH